MQLVHFSNSLLTAQFKGTVTIHDEMREKVITDLSFVRFQVLTAASMMFILHGSITQKTALNIRFKLSW
jgi:hypothetical protein